jgi:molybdopterin synthase catalytic subunit
MSVPALTDDALDLARVVAAVLDPEHGGIASFLGVTRRESARREFEAIEYVAYDRLAATEIAAIMDEARAQFGATVMIQHRTGTVPVGEASVAIAASAPHRPAAFAACRYAIDELKARVPIWKRAHFADGTAAWFDDLGGVPPASTTPGPHDA